MKAPNDTNFIPADGNDALQNFQVDGIDYLYNLEPQQLNLFMVTDFYDPYASSKSGWAASTYANTDPVIPTNLAYRINAVNKVMLPSLEIPNEFFDSKAIRMNIVTNGKRSQPSISIKWVEDAYLTVRRYHMNWMNHWYNRYLDCMVCGQKGKFRNMVLYMYHAVNMNQSTGAPILVNKPIARFEFQGLIPLEIPEIAFDYSSNSNEELVEIEYKYNALNIFFYPYTKEEKAFIGGMAEEIQSGLKLSDVKNTAITGNSQWGGKVADILSGVTDGYHDKVYYI